MSGGSGVQRLPQALAEDYSFLSCLKESPGRRTLLLRDKQGRLAVWKWSANGEEHPEEEFQLLRQLSGAPKVYRWGREEDGAWLLREYVPGETLLDYAQKRGPLPAGEATEIGLSLCRTLKPLHSQTPPVVHRDVKAENVIRTPEGQYVLIDFGIARRYDGAAQRDTQVLGTPASAPPEQFGYCQTDPRSDVYAVGVLLHELTTGEPDLRCGTVPRPLSPIAARCTRFDPAKRYPNAAALELALMRAKHRPKRLLALSVLLPLLPLAAVFCLAGRTPSAGSPPPERYVFASPAIEAEVCRQLGKAPGTVTYSDLDAIESLLLCGTESFAHWEQIFSYGCEVQLDSQTVASQGDIDTLEDIPQMKNLRTLSLCNQSISELSPLAGCGITQLALHGNQISDLTPLESCSFLRELDISDNPVSDLSPLKGCLNLWKLNAGATALRTLDGLPDIPLLGTLYLHDCPLLADISALEGAELLNTLHLRPASERQLTALGRLIQLECLGLWQAEGMSSLKPLERLTELFWLFIHTDGLSSLDGIEALEKLEFLDIRSAHALDLEPLSGLERLSGMNVTGLSPTSWSPLAELTTLEQIICLPGQEAPLRQALGDKAPAISVAP